MKKINKVNSFTLTEVLIVLIIIGILVLLALPNLLPLITKAKSTEAKIQLEHIYTLEKSYFFEKSSYASTLIDLNFEQEKLVIDGGNANYQLEIIEASEQSFVARATSVVDFDSDGVYNTWEINEEKKLTEVISD